MIHLLPDELIVTEACSDGLLVFDLTTVRCTFLDRTGAQMWTALKSSSDLEEAAERLQVVFAADRAVLHRDLLEFCDGLVAEGLATREPHQPSAEALAGSQPAEVEALPPHDWVAGLLGAATRDGVAGDVVLLDVPPPAVAAIRRALARDDVDDLTLRFATVARRQAATGPAEAPQAVCLLWVHTTDADALAQALHTWLAWVGLGGYVVVSGLEAHEVAAVTSVAAVTQAADGPDIVPVEWLTAWWQKH